MFMTVRLVRAVVMEGWRKLILFLVFRICFLPKDPAHRCIQCKVSMPGRRVAGPFWGQAVNQKKTTFTNRYLQIAAP